jgi:hypothetical protein
MAELCGWEMENEYAIFALDPSTMSKYDQEIIHAKEFGSDCCVRQCCGPARANSTEIVLNSDRNSALGIYKKTFGISWCCNACCKAQGSVTTYGPNGSAGQLYQTTDPQGCPGCTPLGFSFQNYDYNGPRSCCGHTPCGTYTFFITDQRNGGNQGSLTKQQQTCSEMFYKTNKYNLVFPPNATNEDKVALIAAALHADYNFFEQSKDN